MPKVGTLLLILGGLLALPVGWYGSIEWRRNQALIEFERRGYYLYVPAWLEDGLGVRGVFNPAETKVLRLERTMPKWLGTLLPDSINGRWFVRVEALAIGEDPQDFDPQEMELAKAFPEVTDIYFSARYLSDEHLASLGNFKRLGSLRLSATGNIGGGIRVLGELPKCRSLSIESPKVTDDALRELIRLAPGRTYYIWSPSVCDLDNPLVQELSRFPDVHLRTLE